MKILVAELIFLLLFLCSTLLCASFIFVFDEFPWLKRAWSISASWIKGGHCYRKPGEALQWRGKNLERTLVSISPSTIFMEILSWNSYNLFLLEHKGIWKQGLPLAEIQKNCICNCMKPNNSSICYCRQICFSSGGKYSDGKWQSQLIGPATHINWWNHDD